MPYESKHERSLQHVNAWWHNEDSHLWLVRIKLKENQDNGKTRAWVKRTPEEIEELKKKIEEKKAEIEAKKHAEK